MPPLDYDIRDAYATDRPWQTITSTPEGDEVVAGYYRSRTDADVNLAEGETLLGPLRPPLPCGCYPHVTKTHPVWGFQCVTEDQAYCNFECPHEEDE